MSLASCDMIPAQHTHAHMLCVCCVCVLCVCCVRKQCKRTCVGACCVCCARARARARVRMCHGWVGRYDGCRQVQELYECWACRHNESAGREMWRNTGEDGQQDCANILILVSLKILVLLKIMHWHWHMQACIVTYCMGQRLAS